MCLWISAPRHPGQYEFRRYDGQDSLTTATSSPSAIYLRGIERGVDYAIRIPVRLQLSVLAYNLGNLWRRLGLPQRIKNWSLTSLQHRLMKTGGRLIKHARYYWLLFAEGHLNRRLFGDMLRKIWALPVPGG